MLYKDYQKVINLAVKNKPNFKRKSSRTDPGYEVKRRTKTGCLTCRRRKKKCDEEKSGGRCQACIRNFLNCTWPDEARIEQTFSEPAFEHGLLRTPESLSPVSSANMRSPRSPISSDEDNNANFACARNYELVNSEEWQVPKVFENHTKEGDFVIASIDDEHRPQALSK